MLSPAGEHDLAIVVRAFRSLKSHDLDGYLACFDSGLTLELPFAEDSGPVDKEHLARLCRFLLNEHDDIKVSIDEVHEVTVPHRLIIEYHSEFRSTTHGRRYENRYIAKFDLKDDLISRWVEYAKPIPLRSPGGRASS